MNWRTLLTQLGPAPPPLPDLVRASADRFGQVDRRAFLGLCGAGVAALAIDPEQFFRAPTILVPDQSIVLAQTIDEAVVKGLTIFWSDGTRQEIRGTLDMYGGYEGLQRYVAQHGGRLAENRRWIERQVHVLEDAYVRKTRADGVGDHPRYRAPDLRAAAVAEDWAIAR